MSRAKVIKKVPKNFANISEDISSLMKGLLSVDVDSDNVSCIPVILKKIVAFKNVLHESLTLLTKLISALKDKVLIASINKFTRKIFAEYKFYRDYDLSLYENTLDYTTLEFSAIKELKVTYLKLKESKMIKSIQIITKNISLSGINEDNYDEFLLRAQNLTIQLKIFYRIKIVGETLNIDFCSIFDNSSFSKHFTDEEKKQVYDNLLALLECGKSLRATLNIPDYDSDFIFPQLLNIIEAFTHDVPGCDNAFKLIKNSSKLFEKNCNNYLRKSFTTNPTAIFTDFIEDIIKSEKELIDETGPNNAVKELITLLRCINKKVNKVVKAKGTTIPDNVLQIINAAEKISTEYQLNSTGELHSTTEIQQMQQEFAELFM